MSNLMTKLDSLNQVISLSLLESIAMHDRYEAIAHMKRVAAMSVLIYDRYAMNNNLSPELRVEYRKALEEAALIHDIGKLAIPSKLLETSRKISEDEKYIIKQHTTLGLSYCSDFFSNPLVVEVVLHHHERWDGVGYPGFSLETNEEEKGLYGKDIPLSARIVSIADTYDALSSFRSYRIAWTPEAVNNEILSQSGRQFDPELVMIFFDLYSDIQMLKNEYQ